MVCIAEGGRPDQWIDANLRWLRDIFGEENLVSCVLHMDEKTPHLHATVVPITYAEAMRPFGLQRGIVGFTARHVANSGHYKQLMRQYEEDAAKLQA